MGRLDDRKPEAEAEGQRCPAAPVPPSPLPPCPAPLHTRWERAIARFQGAVACSPDCPLAAPLLAVVRDLGRAGNPLAGIFPELRP